MFTPILFCMRGIIFTSLSLTLCACANSPAKLKLPPVKQTTTITNHESISPASPPRGSTIQPKMTVEQALLRLLVVIRGSESIRDFTPEYLSKTIGMDFISYRPGSHSAAGFLTPTWWYSMEMNLNVPVIGPQFLFALTPPTSNPYPDMTEVCKIDFEQFASALEKMGFNRNPDYAEHGRYVGDTFDKPTMHIQISGRSEKMNPNPDKIGHSCIKMIVIN